MPELAANAAAAAIFAAACALIYASPIGRWLSDLANEWTRP